MLNIEQLAMELHEAGRAAVESGQTVAHSMKGEPSRKFLEWYELTDQAKEGRRVQARYLLERFRIAPATGEFTASSTLNQINARVAKWSKATFNPNNEYRADAIAAHLSDEVAEVVADPTDHLEIADCYILLAGLCGQVGVDAEAAIAEKMTINMRRRWGQPDARGVVNHIKEDS
jgi:Protein of unknown function (DUF550)